MDTKTLKSAIKNYGKDEVKNAINEHGEDVVEAALECDVNLADIGEAYQGKFRDDKAFTQDFIEQCGDLPGNLPSFIHINWEKTARDIMMDYSESNGHYFRNL